jgi:site-specific DNA recombinase
MNPSAHTVFAYVRLSREEIEEGVTEEKFERHKGYVRSLAERHGLELLPENIVVERQSGGKLAGRPGLVRLLELAESGRLTHLIAQAYDRISRGDKRDQLTIEDALYEGEVTVITSEEVMRFDDSHDETFSDLRAIFSRAELRRYSKRMRDRNAAEWALNHPPKSGAAPYGFKRSKDADSGYTVLPHEYAVLQECFRRILARESIRSIHRDLVERRVPTPGHGRRQKPAELWDYSTLYRTLLNPFYAGYHARVTKRTRGKGYTWARPEDYEISPGPIGGWAKPITLAQHYEIRALFAAYAEPSRARTSLLAGILACQEGSRMHAAGAGRSYGCTCAGGVHPNTRIPGKTTHYTTRPYWDEFARRMVVEFARRLEGRAAQRLLKASLVDKGGLDRAEIAQQLSRALRDRAQREDDVRALATDQERQRRLLGDSLYETVLTKARGEWEVANAAVELLQEQASAPDRRQALTLLQVARAHGIEAFWHDGNVDERRELLRILIKRIVLEPSEKHKHSNRAKVEWQDWVKEEGLGFAPPPEFFPGRRRKKAEV